MNVTFQHILVPYNGTSGSQKAFKKAVALAELTKSKITVLTCLEERSTFGLFKTKTNKKDFDNEYKLVTQEHVKLKKYSSQHGVSPGFKIIKSNVASHEILEFAEKNKIDLIIMGKKNFATRFEKTHYHSTIEDISKNFQGAILILN
ncbi:MAG: universal stress protein [Nitrosopumilus sp.]|nr:universal stress protein [Nitrosopumilus sp.]